jgi:hypothetical protein
LEKNQTNPLTQTHGLEKHSKVLDVALKANSYKPKPFVSKPRILNGAHPPIGEKEEDMP